MRSVPVSWRTTYLALYQANRRARTPKTHSQLTMLCTLYLLLAGRSYLSAP
jgi:hypothetical protein